MPDSLITPEALLSEVGSSEQALAAFLKGIIGRAATKQSQMVVSHPIVLANAVKNLVSDQRDNPPLRLLKWTLDTINAFPEAPAEEPDLALIREEEMPGTLFISDLEDAIYSGDRDRVIRTAGQWFRASASPESLLDVFIQVLAGAGPGWPEFLYAAHRCAAFCQSGETLWNILLAIIRQIPESGLDSVGYSGDSINPIDLSVPVFMSNDTSKVDSLAAIWRLWDLESPRQSFIRSALLMPIQTLSVESNGPAGNSNKATFATDQLPDFAGWITHRISREDADTDSLISTVRLAESLRFLIRHVNQDKLPLMETLLKGIKEGS